MMQAVAAAAVSFFLYTNEIMFIFLLGSPGLVNLFLEHYFKPVLFETMQVRA